MVLFNYVLGPRDFTQEDHFGNDWKVIDIDEWVTEEEEGEGDNDDEEEDSHDGHNKVEKKEQMRK
jgi:hypothetical protein